MTAMVIIISAYFAVVRFVGARHVEKTITSEAGTAATGSTIRTVEVGVDTRRVVRLRVEPIIRATYRCHKRQTIIHNEFKKMHNELKCELCGRNAILFYENDDKDMLWLPKWSIRCERHKIPRKKQITREEMIVFKIMGE